MDETEDKLAPILAHCRMLGYEKKDYARLRKELVALQLLDAIESVYITSDDGITWTESTP